MDGKKVTKQTDREKKYCSIPMFFYFYSSDPNLFSLTAKKIFVIAVSLCGHWMMNLSFIFPCMAGIFVRVCGSLKPIIQSIIIPSVSGEMTCDRNSLIRIWMIALQSDHDCKETQQMVFNHDHPLKSRVVHVSSAI